jgi:hypothetical protein
VIVSDGLTPRLAEMADPSTTCSPSWPYTRCQGSITPVPRESPIVAPPMKCAVSGRLNGSPIEPPAVPPMIRAIRRTASFPTGIQVGLGAPWPCREVSRRRPVSRLALVNVVIELSRVCITRATTVRSDQCLTSYSARTLPRCLTISRSQVRHRGALPSSSVSTVCRNDIALLPLPYRTGSMCVWSSGWNDEVIAIPSL